jgi:hypothetical protein
VPQARLAPTGHEALFAGRGPPARPWLGRRDALQVLQLAGLVAHGHQQRAVHQVAHAVACHALALQVGAGALLAGASSHSFAASARPGRPPAVLGLLGLALLPLLLSQAGPFGVLQLCGRPASPAAGKLKPRSLAMPNSVPMVTLPPALTLRQVSRAACSS